MLKVECESCKAPYQVDERRVPPTGLKMRCPKCGHTFLVTDPSKGAAPAGPGQAPADRPKMKQTMVGVGAFGAGGKPPPAVAKLAGPAPAAPPPATFDDGLDGLALPAVRSAAPKVAKAAPAQPAPPPPAPAAAAAPPTFGGLDDLDLPALAGEVGLPAAVNRHSAQKGAPAP
jgi:predicted Zn finger-like uncharacterized protein